MQHIAFATRDIFATAAAFSANGFETLAISPNYFDDIEARFGLDPDFADRLRAANILYDRDEHGEYFQLYSPNFGEGFFFEIVERRGGYAATAPPTPRSASPPRSATCAQGDAAALRVPTGDRPRNPRTRTGIGAVMPTSPSRT